MLPIRPSVAGRFEKSWAEVAGHGAWWSAAERHAMVAELRHASACRMCSVRAEALSPNSVEGEHESLGFLADAVVDVIHRMRTDSGRLTRAWFDSIVPDQISPEAYVEIVGVVGTVMVMDTWATAMQMTLKKMSPAAIGEPTREASLPVTDAGAWVPILDVGAHDRGVNPNIFRSLALAPSARELFLSTFSQHYMLQDMRLELERPQIELIASRVSALNQCFY